MKFTYFELFYKAAITEEKFSGTFRWKDVEDFCSVYGLKVPAPNHLKEFRIARGRYNFAAGTGNTINELKEIVTMEEINKVEVEPEDLETFIPRMDKNYVPFGISEDLSTIIQAHTYASTYITGETGYGKTYAVMQVCSALDREVIRLNCTPFTNEDELMGNYILEGGDMVWKDGPVLYAMERGAILLLDEADALDPKRGAFPLYSLLEGNGVFVKKLNKRYFPKKGFNIIATGNTKGSGDTTGRYAGTNSQNVAFMDRFKITLEHGAPAPGIEKDILTRVDKTGDRDFINKVVNWCKTIRDTYAMEGCSEFISTRRACDMMDLYGIFKNRAKVVSLVTARFDDEVKKSFVELYNKIDVNAEEHDVTNDSQSSPTVVEDEYPF